MRTTSSLSLICLLAACGGEGPMGATGPTGPTGPGPTPLLGLSFPASGLIGRQTTVQLLGYASHFSSTSTVSFGDAAIQVSAITAGSTGLLQANLNIGATATFGPHTITVTTKGAAAGGKDEALTLANGFSVLPTLVPTATGNSKTTPQGGVADFSLTNADSLANPLPDPGASFGMLQLGAGLKAVNVSFTPTDISAAALVDALRPAGPVPLSATAIAHSGKSMTYVMDPADPNAPAVVARAPTALTVGTALTGQTIATSGGKRSNLYQFASTANNQVVQFIVGQAGPAMIGNTLGAVAPSSGSFAGSQLFAASDNAGTETGLAYLPTTGNQYLALFNTGFSSGTGSEFSLTAKVATASSFSTMESTPDSPTMPLAKVSLASPMYSLNGAMDSATDIDYIQVTPSKTGPLYVLVSSDALVIGSGFSPVLTIVASDCKTSIGSQAHTIMTQAPVTQGTTYCVIVTDANANPGFTYPRPYKMVISGDL